MCLVRLCNLRQALVTQMLPTGEASVTLQSKKEDKLSLGKKTPLEERLSFRLTSLVAHLLESSTLLLPGEGRPLRVEKGS